MPARPEAAPRASAPRQRRLAPLPADVQGTRPIPWWAKASLGFEILVDYCRVRWYLSRLDLPRVVERLRATPARRAPESAGSLRVTSRTGIRLGTAVVRTLGVMPTDCRCLMRSLVLTSVLARRGIATTLTIAARPGSTFEAHAWIERDGIPLLPPADAGYENLTTF